MTSLTILAFSPDGPSGDRPPSLHKPFDYVTQTGQLIGQPLRLRHNDAVTAWRVIPYATRISTVQSGADKTQTFYYGERQPGNRSDNHWRGSTTNRWTPCVHPTSPASPPAPGQDGPVVERPHKPTADRTKPLRQRRLFEQRWRKYQPRDCTPIATDRRGRAPRAHDPYLTPPTGQPIGHTLSTRTREQRRRFSRRSGTPSHRQLQQDHSVVGCSDRPARIGRVVRGQRVAVNGRVPCHPPWR